VHIRSDIPTIDIPSSKTQNVTLSSTRIESGSENPGKFVSNNFKDLKDEVEYLSNRFETEVVSHPKVFGVNSEHSTLYLNPIAKSKLKRSQKHVVNTRKKSETSLSSRKFSLDTGTFQEYEASKNFKYKVTDGTGSSGFASQKETTVDTKIPYSPTINLTDAKNYQV